MAAVYLAIAKKAAACALGAGVAGYAANNIYSEINKVNCAGRAREAYQKFMPQMDFPDLSQHNNCMAKILTPKMYGRLRDKVSVLLVY